MTVCQEFSSMDIHPRTGTRRHMHGHTRAHALTCPLFYAWQTFSVCGRVTEEGSGMAVSGAAVRALHVGRATEEQPVAQAVANVDGVFDLGQLPCGAYDVRAALPIIFCTSL